MEKKKKIVLISKAVVLDNDKILLVKRDRPWHKEVHEKWEFPGGKVEFDEHPKETAIRECKEESGFDIEIKEMLPFTNTHLFNHPDRDTFVVLLYFLGNKIGGEASNEDHNIIEVKWFDINDLPSCDELMPGTVETIDFIKNK